VKDIYWISEIGGRVGTGLMGVERNFQRSPDRAKAQGRIESGSWEVQFIAQQKHRPWDKLFLKKAGQMNQLI
jgi:hypothetical protein